MMPKDNYLNLHVETNTDHIVSINTRVLYSVRTLISKEFRLKCLSELGTRNHSHREEQKARL